MELKDLISNMSFRDKNWVLIIPAVLMVIDFLTGLYQAWSSGHLKSYKMREGLNHKVGELSVLLIGELFTYGMQLPYIFIHAISFYVMFMEGISICENLDKMGVWIPKFVRVGFKKIKDSIDNGGKIDNNTSNTNPTGKEDDNK